MGDGSRRTEIIDAAYVCFTRHGVRRTTMDDLARQAGMSRPAVYQYFRNKEEAFRSLVERLLTDALSASERAAEAEGDLADRLAGILSAKLALVMRVWRDSPSHAAELLSVDARLPAELVPRYEEAMRDLLSHTVQRSRPEADSAEVAEILLAFTRGLEAGVSDPSTLPGRLRRGVGLIVAGLGSPTTTSQSS